MTCSTILHHRFLRNRKEADARVVEIYNKYPSQVIKILSYAGDNKFVNSVVDIFEFHGKLTTRQMYAAVNIIKQINGENIYARPTAQLRAKRVEALTNQVRKLTAENAELKKQLRIPLI